MAEKKYIWKLSVCWNAQSIKKVILHNWYSKILSQKGGRRKMCLFFWCSVFRFDHTSSENKQNDRQIHTFICFAFALDFELSFAALCRVAVFKVKSVFFSLSMSSQLVKWYDVIFFCFALSASRTCTKFKRICVTCTKFKQKEGKVVRTPVSLHYFAQKKLYNVITTAWKFRCHFAEFLQFTESKNSKKKHIKLNDNPESMRQQHEH